MNRLQGLDSAEQYLVTLNARDRIDPTKVVAVMDYEHPIYDLRAIEAQARLASLSTPRRPSPAPTTAGASTRTAAARASRRPATSGWPGDMPSTRRGFDTTTSTTCRCCRRSSTGSSPIVGEVRSRHEFRHRVYQWLVDLDRIPRPPWYLRPVAGFDARDHLGGTGPDARPTSRPTSNASWPATASTSARPAGSSCSPTRGSSVTCSTR